MRAGTASLDPLVEVERSAGWVAARLLVTRLAGCSPQAARRGASSSRGGRGVSVAATPERGAVVQRAKELVHFARSQGYRTKEPIRIIEDIS
jgi:hypothetical protein